MCLGKLSDLNCFWQWGHFFQTPFGEGLGCLPTIWSSLMCLDKFKLLLLTSFPHLGHSFLKPKWAICMCSENLDEPISFLHSGHCLLSPSCISFICFLRLTALKSFWQTVHFFFGPCTLLMCTFKFPAVLKPLQHWEHPFFPSQHDDQTLEQDHQAQTESPL